MEENTGHVYIAIDLKSFYASVECVERNLDPLNVNLVVADASRTNKTICLAVSPSLKAYGISGRARLFEVVQTVDRINSERKWFADNKTFSGGSYYSSEINANKNLKIEYITATPRMALYMEYSTRIYQIYLKYAAPEDIHVYSIDEVFIDVTHYLKAFNATPRELTERIIKDILAETGITATGGIGTNLYLCKVAMDIVAKHEKADENGVRIAELDEMKYRKLLWNHRPLTDFWRVGKGYRKKLEKLGMYTMGDVARCSIGGENDFYNEELLYKTFGINAELLIDHAWGYEPCTMADIKSYKPESNSLGAGQVLSHGYEYDKAKLVLKEMADSLSLDLLDKHVVTNQIVITVCYDAESAYETVSGKNYDGDLTTDYYGRVVPKHAHGTENLKVRTSSAKEIVEASVRLFERIVNPDLLVRRIYVNANKVIPEAEASAENSYEQLSLFTDYIEIEKEKQKEDAAREKEKKVQQAMLDMKKKFGKNAVLKGMNLEDGGTMIARNGQIGGHKA